MIFRVYFMAGCMLNSAAITDFAHQKILQMHDDIIGDNWESYPGLPWIPFIHSFFNFEKIEKLKIKQVSLYKKLMKNIYSYKNKKNIFYEIQIPIADYKNLHVYPVGITVSENKTKDLIEFLHTHNASVWIKFPGCEWNKDKSCLFLPLGFHISENDIRYVVRLLQQFISNPQ